MYTVSQWLIIVRNILITLGYNTESCIVIDEEINESHIEDAEINYKMTLQEILDDDDDWGDQHSTLGDPE